MLYNYLITAFRNFQKNKLYTIINILGLAVGLACFILIMLYVQDELSYDSYHSKQDRIYRLCEKIELEGQGENSSSNPFPTGPALVNDYPQLIEGAVRFFNFQTDKTTLAVENRKFNQEQVFFADSNVFQVFDFPLTRGNREEVLNGPNKIVINQELADKFFPGEDALGKSMTWEGGLSFEVTGILGAIPEQSHFPFKALISFPTLKQIMGQGLNRNWVWNPNWTYLLFKEGVDPQELEAQFPTFVQKYYPDFMKDQITHHLQPLVSIHLESDLDYEIIPNNKKSTIYIFGLIGLFVLLIACINFMNLSTAQSNRRAQEVGVRKVLGAFRGQLVGQFLAESILTCLLAVCGAYLLISFALPAFNELAGKSFNLNIIFQPQIIFGALGLGILTGLLAGIYPAFILSSFLPVEVMKGKLKLHEGNEIFRKILVVAQFTISLALIIATSVIYIQYQFLQNSDTGFEQEHIVIIPVKRPLIPKFTSFRDDLLSNPKVEKVSMMNEIIGIHHNIHEYNYEGMKPGEWIYFPSLLVDEDFVETMKMEIVAGRNFSRDHATDDSLAVIVNEAMVREMGWAGPGDALNRQFYTPHGRERIIGVMKDFHAVSLLDPIRPFVLDMQGSNRGFFFRNVVARIQSKDVASTLVHIENSWDKVCPQHPFQYSFLGEHIDKLYAQQDRLGNLVTVFSVLAILVSCLGLFALAFLTTAQRRKEVGIRKIMGASVGSISFLLAKDILKWVLLANIFAWPLAAWAMSGWLESFAYKIDMPWWVFAAAGIAVILVAILTVLWQTIRSGMSNPVEVLRNE